MIWTYKSQTNKTLKKILTGMGFNIYIICKLNIKQKIVKIMLSFIFLFYVK